MNYFKISQLRYKIGVIILSSLGRYSSFLDRSFLPVIVALLIDGWLHMGDLLKKTGKYKAVNMRCLLI